LYVYLNPLVRFELNPQCVTGDRKHYILKILSGILSLKRGSDLAGQEKSVRSVSERNQLDTVEYQTQAKDPFLNTENVKEDKIKVLFLKTS